MWKLWIKKQDIQDPIIEKSFEPKYCSEPYLRFTKEEDETSDSIYFLTTNPGAGFDLQERKNILENKSMIKSDESYYSNAKNLADYYIKELISGSKARIKHMEYLAKICGYDNFIQVETIPYHSENLPEKSKLVRLVRNGNNKISEYIEITKEYLMDKNVISIQAGNCRDIKKMSDWSKLQCEIIGLDIDKSECISTIKNEKKKDTGCLYIERKNNFIKALSLRAGANDLPGNGGCDIIANKYNIIKQKINSTED